MVMVYSTENDTLRSPRSVRIAPETWNSTKSRLVPCVSFASKVDTYYTLGREDYSKRDRKAYWFEEKDYQRTMEICVKILKKDGEGGSHFKRGLEKWSTLGIAVTSMNTDDAYGAVLDEQAAQREEGKCCDERIAENYRNVSQRCQKKALKLARQDAIEASEYLAKRDSPPTSLEESWEQVPHLRTSHVLGGCPPTRFDESRQQCTKRHTGRGESHKQPVPRYIVFTKGTGRETDMSPMKTATTQRRARSIDEKDRATTARKKDGRAASFECPSALALSARRALDRCRKPIGNLVDHYFAN
jgi:hypothetical protein